MQLCGKETEKERKERKQRKRKRKRKGFVEVAGKRQSTLGFHERKRKRKGTRFDFGVRQDRTLCKQLSHLPGFSCWTYFGEFDDWSEWAERAISAVNEFYRDNSLNQLWDAFLGLVFELSFGTVA